jgi:hypothetical protein
MTLTVQGAVEGYEDQPMGRELQSTLGRHIAKRQHVNVASNNARREALLRQKLCANEASSKEEVQADAWVSRNCIISSNI